MWLLATYTDVDTLYLLIFLVGGYGLLHLFLPGVMLELKRFGMELGGTQPIEGHLFWSKGWVRFIGLIFIGFAGFLFYHIQIKQEHDPRESSPPRPGVSRPAEDEGLISTEDLFPNSPN